MRNSTRKKVLGTAAAVLAAISVTTSAGAATYTAIASGNYSSGATWSGGLAPSTTATGDLIVIPTGVTVTMDQSLAFNSGLSGLTVNGSLVSSGSTSLSLSNVFLLGAGSINVDSLALSTTSGLVYTGSITAQRMSSTGLSLAAAATINVVQRLHAMSGVISLGSGSLNLSSGATIVVHGGTFATSGTGLLGLTNNYHLRYESTTNLSTGIEASGNGLRKIEIAMGANSGLTLSADMNVRDTLMLTSGYLRLSGRNLTFSGAGNFASSGSGSIVSGNTSSITLTGTSTFAGGLRFRADSNTVNNFTVNSAGSNTTTFKLGSSVMVNGTLSLQNGRLHIDTSMLAVAGSLSGGSSSSYVITGRNGRLGMNVVSSASAMYHIGTATNYAPAMVAANSGNASGMLSVGVEDSVRAMGTTGAAWSGTRKMVNATWHVTSASASSVNINLTTMWSGSMEVNGFNRNQAYISHYTGGNWDVAASASATATANGMYSLSRNNITSLSPFAVMDRDNTLGTKTAVRNLDVQLYPNPATSTVFIGGKMTGTARVEVYNATGTLVRTQELRNGNISVSDLSNGAYLLRLHTADGDAALHFVKQ